MSYIDKIFLPEGFIPRPNQLKAYNACVEYLEDKKEKKSAYLIEPTGGGKSNILAMVSQYACTHLKGKVLILQPKIELLNQNYAKYINAGFEATKYSASANEKEFGEVTYATLGSVRNLGKEFKEQGYKYVFVDECQEGYSPDPNKSFRIFIDALKPRKVIGVTATPFRLRASKDFEDVGYSIVNLFQNITPRIFSKVLSVTQVAEMVKNKYWCDLKYHNYEYNIEGLKRNSTGQDFTEESIEKVNAINKVENKVASLVRSLINNGETRILVMMKTVKDANTLNDWLNVQFGEGTSCCIHAKTKKKVRKEVYERWIGGNIKVATNVGTLHTGVDYPELNNIIVGRPLGNVTLWYQLLGRGVRNPRPKEGKICNIHDLCGNYSRFGDITTYEFKTAKDFRSDKAEKLQLFNDREQVTGVRLDALGLGFDDEIFYDLKIGFGKHSKLKVSQLPSGYLKWIISDAFVPTSTGQINVKKMCRLYHRANNC